MEENVPTTPKIPQDPDEKMEEGMGLPTGKRMLGIGAQKKEERGVIAVESLPQNPGRAQAVESYTPPPESNS